MAGLSPSKPDFEILFQAVPAAYLVLAPDLTIVAASDAYLQATMTTREGILGRPLFDVFPDNPDDPLADGVSNLRASLMRVLERRTSDTMAVQKYDVRRQSSANAPFEERFWSPVNTPVLGQDANIQYIIHRVEDVTDFVQLKQHEAAQGHQTAQLREHAQRVEAELFQRAQEIQHTNRQLEAANKELATMVARIKELDDVRTRFFANVSHELRSPLSLIIGPVDRLIKRQDLDASARGDLDLIARNARLLLRHVANLLDIAKLEAGAMALDYAKVDASRLLQLVASYFESLVADRRIEFRINAPESATVQIDPEKIERVLINLVGNAIKFTPDGGRAECAMWLDGDDLWLTVDDSGPGVPAEQREAIFERFRQVDDSQTRRFGGTGLGLSIVREFVQLHGGQVHAEASALGGARFCVGLPRYAPPGANLRPWADTSGTAHEFAVHAADVRPVSFGRLAKVPDDGRPLVLVVEDNREMNRFICETLGERFRVANAFDGQEGLVRALAIKPDVIVSDVMMPRMSGAQFVEELRLHRGMDKVPVLMLTAKADESQRIELLSQGAQDHLAKPFLPDELVVRVANLLSTGASSSYLQRQLAIKSQEVKELAERLRRLGDAPHRL